MTIIDILKEKLLGKEILLYEFNFKLDKKSLIEKRYFIDKEIVRDERMSYIGETYKTIVDISGYSVPYEGDAIYIYIDAESTNQMIGISVIDNLIINNR